MFANFFKNFGQSNTGSSSPDFNFDFDFGDLFKDGPDLNASVGLDGMNNTNDVAKVESLLGANGALDLNTTEGPTGYPGMRLDQGIKNFQKDNGLKVDGIVNPGGETIRALTSDEQFEGLPGNPAEEPEFSIRKIFPKKPIVDDPKPTIRNRLLPAINSADTPLQPQPFHTKSPKATQDLTRTMPNAAKPSQTRAQLMGKNRPASNQSNDVHVAGDPTALTVPEGVGRDGTLTGANTPQYDFSNAVDIHRNGTGDGRKKLYENMTTLMAENPKSYNELPEEVRNARTQYYMTLQNPHVPRQRNGQPVDEIGMNRAALQATRQPPLTDRLRRGVDTATQWVKPEIDPRYTNEMHTLHNGTANEREKMFHSFNELMDKNPDTYAQLPDELKAARERFFMTSQNPFVPRQLNNEPVDEIGMNRAAQRSVDETSAGFYGTQSATQPILETANTIINGADIMTGGTINWGIEQKRMENNYKLTPNNTKFTRSSQNIGNAVKNIGNAMNLAPTVLQGPAKALTAPIAAAGSLKNMGEIASDLHKSGVSPAGQRMGAYIAGTASMFGGKGAATAMNKILTKKFGTQLADLTSKEFAAINEHLMGQGVTLTANGLVKTAAKGKH